MLLNKKYFAPFIVTLPKNYRNRRVICNQFI